MFRMMILTLCQIEISPIYHKNIFCDCDICDIWIYIQDISIIYSATWGVFSHFLCPGWAKLPKIDFNKDAEPHLSSFVGSKSWLLFNKLGLFEKQEWLNLPCDYWHNFTDFRTAKGFVLQINTYVLIRCNEWFCGKRSKIDNWLKKLLLWRSQKYLSQVIEQNRQSLSCQNLSKNAMSCLLRYILWTKK